MKKYRIKYWLGSIVTDWKVKAENEEQALERFKRIKGKDKRIISVEDITQMY